MIRNDFLIGHVHNNSLTNDVLIRVGEVVSVYDVADGLRIKVRIEQDKKISDDKLPYAFPLLPKTFQSVPKVGEAVFVFLGKMGNKDSNRYYIGPLISQPQYFNQDYYTGGYGSATSLIQGSWSQQLEPISNYSETVGSFPNVNDIAMIGRKSEDIILKDNEIDLRCGIRTEPFNAKLENKDLFGDVIFNRQSPAYIQMKYERGIGISKGQNADSVINLVADKINLISHKDNNVNDLIVNNQNLINSSDMDKIMTELHQLPYGDILLDVLYKIRDAFLNHVHAYPGLPPVRCSNVNNFAHTNLNDILSENVRIS